MVLGLKTDLNLISSSAFTNVSVYVIINFNLEPTGSSESIMLKLISRSDVQHPSISCKYACWYCYIYSMVCEIFLSHTFIFVFLVQVFDLLYCCGDKLNAARYIHILFDVCIKYVNAVVLMPLCTLSTINVNVRWNSHKICHSLVHFCGFTYQTRKFAGKKSLRLENYD